MYEQCRTINLVFFDIILLLVFTIISPLQDTVCSCYFFLNNYYICLEIISQNVNISKKTSTVSCLPEMTWNCIKSLFSVNKCTMVYTRNKHVKVNRFLGVTRRFSQPSNKDLVFHHEPFTTFNAHL